MIFFVSRIYTCSVVDLALKCRELTRRLEEVMLVQVMIQGRPGRRGLAVSIVNAYIIAMKKLLVTRTRKQSA